MQRKAKRYTCPFDLEKFNNAFLDRVFPFEMRKSKVHELINILQRSMSKMEYAPKFTTFSKYSPTMVAHSRARMSKLILAVYEMVVEQFVLPL